MNIKKKYWHWDDKFNIDVKLGDYISQHIEDGRLEECEENSKYHCGKNGFPWKVSSNENRIEVITYREKFFDVGIDGIWDFEIYQFEECMNLKLKQITSITDGKDVLEVVFRDNFVAIANLHRNR
jgi:hypothetical protein